MTREEKSNLLNELLEIEEKNDIGNLTRAERREFQQWVNDALEQDSRWISVKDRLPQKGEYGDVLVTFVPPAGTLWATVMIARYSDLMGIAKPCFHIGEVGKESFEDITPQVTAWMPLPKRYREVEE